jgi:hypothetical protein
MKASLNAMYVLIPMLFAGCATMSQDDRAGMQGAQTDASVSTSAEDMQAADATGSTDQQGPPVRSSFPETEQAAVANEPARESSQSAKTVQVSCPEPAATEAGQCFTRVLYSPQYRPQEEQVVVRPEYEQISYTEPVYEDVQERVLVREAYTREVEVPALYDTYYEQTLQKPAAKVWKKGRGAVERVDEATGEIYCLVDEPAVYKTVERKELKRPAGTRTETIPAEYTTTTVRKLVKAPEQVRTVVPAEYTTVTKQIVANQASCEYVQVLCEDNATQAKIQEVEQALAGLGYQVNSDGVIDETLTAALKKYQTDRGLPETGLMTAKTVESLGVALETAQQNQAAQIPEPAPTTR